MDWIGPTGRPDPGPCRWRRCRSECEWFRLLLRGSGHHHTRRHSNSSVFLGRCLRMRRRVRWSGRVVRPRRDPGRGWGHRWGRLGLQGPPGAGLRLPRRERRGWRRWRRRGRFGGQKHRAAGPEPCDGLLGASPGVGGVVAFIEATDVPAVQIAGGDLSVAESVSDLHDAAVPLGIQLTEPQLDPATPVELPDDLFVIHRIAPLTRCRSEAVPRENCEGSDIQPVCRSAWLVGSRNQSRLDAVWLRRLCLLRSRPLQR